MADSAAGSLSRGERRKWALCASITEDLLNDLVVFGVGEGISLEPVEQEISLPAMGEVRMRLALTITGVGFELRNEDDSRVRVTVLGSGEVSTRGSDYEGDAIEGTELGLPSPPAPLPVALTALAEPFVELRADHTVSAGLDLLGAELVDLGVDDTSSVPEGVEPESWSGVLQMTSMMFSMMGEQLFAGLAEAVGTVGIDLDSDAGSVLADLGVRVGRADVQVGSGVLSFGFPAEDGVEGRAQPVPVSGKCIGVGLAGSGVDRLAGMLFERVLENTALPFELEISLGEQQIGSRLRQSRVISQRFPDLRSAVRTDIAVRLVGGRLEVAVASAWLELPAMVPGFVNEFNRRLGSLVSLAPLRFRFPATLQVPVAPDSTDTVGVNIDELRVTSDGIGLVAGLA